MATGGDDLERGRVGVAEGGGVGRCMGEGAREVGIIKHRDSGRTD